MCVSSSTELQHDHYTAPAAHMELGLLYLDTGELDKAERTLEASKYVLGERLTLLIDSFFTKLRTFLVTLVRWLILCSTPFLKDGCSVCC